MTDQPGRKTRLPFLLILAAPLLFGGVFAILPVQRVFQAESRVEQRHALKHLKRDRRRSAILRFVAGVICGVSLWIVAGLHWLLGDRANSRPRPAATGPPGRNDPCPCGSGRKYKKCCLS